MHLPIEVERDVELTRHLGVTGFLTNVQISRNILRGKIYIDALGQRSDGEQITLTEAQPSHEAGVFIVSTEQGHRYVVSSHQWRAPQEINGVKLYVPVNVHSPRMRG